MTTILDEAELSVKHIDWWKVLKGEEDLLEMMMDFEDTADEISSSEAAMRVIMTQDPENDEEDTNE